MFGLFKKKESVDASINTLISTESKLQVIGERAVTGSYPQEVQQIHKEFECAAEELLKEANTIISEAATKNVDKVNRLESLGFKQANQVLELKPLLKKAELSKEQIELLAYYKKEYPFNKFITEEQVETICHKYNLVCGDVSRFTGFVPEKNLRNIEKFKLKENEKNSIIVEFVLNGVSNKISVLNVETRIRNGYSHLYRIGEKNNTKWSFQQDNNNLANQGIFYGQDHENIFGLKDYGHLNIRIQDKKLQICAPIKDMDISGLELKEGYKLTKKHIPDPVVLQPVKGGYLILTAWGDEASDPLVVNEINN